ncbi:hypothetical protein B9R42_22070 [Arthrospira platensis PCC 7345]
MLGFITKYVDLGFPAWFWYLVIQNVGTYKQLWGWSETSCLVFNQGVEVPTRRLFRASQPY